GGGGGGDNEAGREPTKTAGWPAFLERQKHPPVADAPKPFPETMFREKCAALVLFGEHRAGVEDRVQNRHMRSQQHVGHSRLLDEFRSFAFPPWILVRPDVGIRPAIEAPRLESRKIIGHQIVTERVPLLNCRPQRIRSWIPAQTDNVPRA